MKQGTEWTKQRTRTLDIHEIFYGFITMQSVQKLANNSLIA
jgi:hypothetical protein